MVASGSVITATPPLSTFVTQIHQHSAKPEAHIFFYTNLREPYLAENPDDEDNWHIHHDWIIGWLEVHHITDRYSIFNGLDPAWYKKQLSNIYDQDTMDDTDLDMTKIFPYNRMIAPEKIFEYCFMQALSAAAIHEDAYLFTTKGSEWSQNSFWHLVEYWKLTQNQNIMRIWRADPTPGACDDGEVMWERGRDAELPEQWVCPVKEPS